MRRSISFMGVLSAALVVAAASSVSVASSASVASSSSASADNSMSSSGGSMGDHMAFLIGSWNCAVKLAMTMGAPENTDHGVVTYAK